MSGSSETMAPVWVQVKVACVVSESPESATTSQLMVTLSPGAKLPMTTVTGFSLVTLPALVVTEPGTTVALAGIGAVKTPLAQPQAPVEVRTAV